ncbi:unnamed protein product [Pieris brassicae]|uniref:Uncharacterized protein n=1 Tax=Pieris brassicae TaxID=7116 RepID=A0A9P0TY35_PIEBR|nr:unnamed protein product [Pieris brassicae]
MLYSHRGVLTPSQVQVNTDDKQDVQGVEINATKKKGAIVCVYARSSRALTLPRKHLRKSIWRLFREHFREYLLIWIFKLLAKL